MGAREWSSNGCNASKGFRSSVGAESVCVSRARGVVGEAAVLVSAGVCECEQVGFSFKLRARLKEAGLIEDTCLI